MVIDETNQGKIIAAIATKKGIAAEPTGQSGWMGKKLIQGQEPYTQGLKWQVCFKS